MTRVAAYQRDTRETRISVRIELDGTGQATVNTGLGMLDHLWGAWVRFSRFDLDLRVEGDTWIDDHHTAEDSAIAVGVALEQALGDRSGIRRFGSAYAPLDEALARSVVDLSGRPWPEVHLGLRREKLGDLACENVGHVLRSLAIASRTTLHVDLLRGENDHHRAEAAFKSCGLAFREAVFRDGAGVPSTKGVLG